MSYYDPPPDPPFVAPSEPEALVQPPTSAPNQPSDPAASSPARKCSVKNCGKELPESHSGKMCDECRGRHRVYASTKRQKRKMEKMAVGLTLQTGVTTGDGAVFMPPDTGHGRSAPHFAQSLPSGSIPNASTNVADGGQVRKYECVMMGWKQGADAKLLSSQFSQTLGRLRLAGRRRSTHAFSSHHPLRL